MTENYRNEGTLLIRNSDIKEGRFEFAQNPIYLDEPFAEANNTRRLQRGDVVTVHTGDIGTSAVIGDREHGAIGFATINTRPFANILESHFLSTFLNTETHKNWAVKMSTGDGRSNYNLKDFNTLQVPVIQFDEQLKIGTFFRTLDTLIANQKRKLDGMKQLKKAYLQQMFPQAGETTPKVRFSGFDGEWTTVKLGDVVEKLKSYSLSRDVETKDMTGYRYIHYGDIHKQVADIISSDEQLPRIKIGDYIPLQQYDLVLADASEDYVGIAEPCIILHDPKERLVAGLHTIAIRPIGTDSLFLYHLFHTDGFRKFGGFVGTGLKVFGITFTNLSKYEMGLPSLEEQTAIGEFFHKLDTQIITHEQKIEQAKQLKAAYLQKMFV